MATERIKSVAKVRKQTLNENLRKKGISEIAQEINFTYKETDSERKIIQKLMSAFKRKINKQWRSLSEEEKINYPKKYMVSDSDYQIEFKLLTNNNNNKEAVFYEYMQQLLGYCTINRDKYIFDYKDLKVVKIKFTNGQYEEVGYGLLNSEIRPNYHKTKRKFTGSNFNYEFLIDVPTLLAEFATAQVLEKFIKHNPDILLYEMLDRKKRIKDGKFIYYVPYVKNIKEKCISFLKQVLPTEINMFDETKSNWFEIEEHMWLFSDDDLEIAAGKIPKKPVKYPIFYNPGFNYIVKLFVQEFELAKRKTEEEIRRLSNYASAFETKKHINQTHLKRMKYNAYLDYYGYVELDNDVDLNKFSYLERELKEFVKHIPIVKRDDFSFRIKKLGKHRAAGIFFPTYKSTILDINHPSSFAHELFHQIDYLLAEDEKVDYFSETLEFRALIDLYKRNVENEINRLPRDSNWVKNWNSKSKYNREYYYQPTEIFARCGEIYLYTQDVELSLTKTRKEIEESPVYPLDETFLMQVKEMYQYIIKNKIPSIKVINNSKDKKIVKNDKEKSFIDVVVNHRYEQIELELEY